MKSNAEMRKESYAVVRSRWFWIIFGVTLLLQGICQGAGWLLGSLHGSMGIVSPADFFSKKLSMLRQGLDYTLPTAEAYRQMAYAGTLEMLVGYVLGAVALFGITAVLLKAVADDRNDVLGAAFGGFGRPLGVTWLLMVMNFFVGLWMLLLIVPGIVAIYRYRAAWYLKSEHPDWGAWKSIDESCRMMYGRKWQAFALDFSFLVWLFLGGMVFAITLGIGIAFARSNALLPSAAGSLASLLGVCFFVFVVCYLFVARAVFYRELAEANRPDLLAKIERVAAILKGGAR